MSHNHTTSPNIKSQLNNRVIKRQIVIRLQIDRRPNQSRHTRHLKKKKAKKKDEVAPS